MPAARGRAAPAAAGTRRLGVKPATLYAYVSRGVLSRARAPDGRASLFSADEVERLARKGRPRRPAGSADITVESAPGREGAGLRALRVPLRPRAVYTGRPAADGP